MNSLSTTVGEGGRIVIPSLFRNLFGLSKGDEVVISCDNTGIHISTTEIALANLQKIARIKRKKGKNSNKKIVESFISERRAEAKREQ